MKFLFLFFWASSALAASALAASEPFCAGRPFTPKGDVVGLVKRYDAFVLGLQKSKTVAKDVQAWLASEGLPFSLDSPVKGPVKGLKAWLEADSMSGTPEAVVFLKKLSLPAGANLRFDKGFLLEGARPVEYRLPFNEFFPSGLQGEEILFVKTLFPLCAEADSVEVALALKPDGSLRALDWKRKDKAVSVSGKRCPGKKYFKGSAYPVCEELRDGASGKKKIFVYEPPMT